MENIAASTTLEYTVSTHGDWTFYSSTYPMSSTKELQLLEDQAQCDLPEVFYGKNSLLIVNPNFDVLLEVSPIEAASLSSFLKRDKQLRTSNDIVECTKDENDKQKLNQIEVIPDPLLVK